MRSFQEIETLITTNPVMLFMKGEKNQPECGFSLQVVEILNELDVDFVTVNVLLRPDIRKDLKEYSNWPTFPQLYINGELVGGADIVKSLHLNQELEQLIGNLK